MAQPNTQQLLDIIERDDLNAFNALMKDARCGNYRLGRFPVLSLLYLYRARKILSAYEAQFIKIPSWEELSEPASILKKFSRVAGKCLRLYFGEVVSPLEMLLMLCEEKKVKKLYPQVKCSEGVKGRLKAIYAIKYALKAEFKGNEILFERRPLNRREGQRILAICLSCVFAASVVIAVPVSATALFGKRKGGDITRASHIDFSAHTTYTLQRDIKISTRYAGKALNCNIEGNGHKLILEKGATLGALNGELSGVEIQTSGSPVFSVVGPTAAITDVTVNVKGNLTKTAQGAALIAETNYGRIDGVTLNVSGSLSALAGRMDGTDELIFGGMVVTNSYAVTPTQIYYAVIENCTVNYHDFSLKGETMANATFGGIVGVNSGIVKDSTVTGSITADTFDLGGACYVNGNLLQGITNEANLSQTALGDGWTPIVSGIVVENASRVEACKNTGSITAIGVDSVISGGIAARTYGSIKECLSSGNISVTGQSVYAGNIFGRSEVTSDARFIYFGTTNACMGTGNIEVTGGGEESCVGGIGGFVQAGTTETSYLGGGATNCIFTGEIKGEFSYQGGIVGACSEVMYDYNFFTLNGVEYVNFEGNYYLESGLPSIGAAISSEGKFKPVAGKGAVKATYEEIKKTETYLSLAELFHL